MSSRAPEKIEATSNRPRKAAIGVAASAAIGGVLVADRVAGVDDTIALAGIGYLVYLVSYHVTKHVGNRRHPAAATVSGTNNAGDVDMFSAFLDALHDQS